jgi:hypothetical protein
MSIFYFKNYKGRGKYQNLVEIKPKIENISQSYNNLVEDKVSQILRKEATKIIK